MDKQAIEDEIRELKQKFLQENIIDKKYDTTEFLTYLTNIKNTEEATDIDFWSFDDLKTVKIYDYC